ncbi:MAG: hypothetical protein HGA85_02835 [Nanoarchaeota archaeon]|nr:hypothetical protein [Nanoarchaeota archaeon]
MLPDLESSVIYHIFPDRFCNEGQRYEVDPWGSPPNGRFQGGTLAGIKSKLDYILSLGCDMIYLNPIFSSPSNHRYDAVSYTEIDKRLGTLDDFSALVSAMHAKGMRLMMDIAFNHTSTEHPKFREALSGSREASGWYHFADGDRYEDGWVRKDGKSYLGWYGYEHMPKLNISNVDVRLYHLNTLKFWSDLGADAYRFDVPSDINDRYFWGDVASAAKDKFRLAELWWEQKDWLRENQMHGQMNYPLLYYLMNFFAQDSIKWDELSGTGLGEGATKDFAKSNRDMPTFCQSIERLYAVGKSPDSDDWKISRRNMNLTGTTHDTARLTTYLPNPQIRDQILVFTMLSPGIPSIFYGDEYGMEGRKDPDNRGAMDWGMAKKYNQHAALIRRLAELRKAPAFSEGDYKIVYAENDVYASTRTAGDKHALMVFNRSANSKNVTIPVEHEMSDGEESVFKGKSIAVPAHSYRIFMD